MFGFYPGRPHLHFPHGHSLACQTRTHITHPTVQTYSCYIIVITHSPGSCGKEEDVGTFASAGIACKWQYTWHRLRTKGMKSLEATVVLLAAEKPYLICTVEKLPDVKYITSFVYFCQAELCRPLKVSSHNWVKLHHKKCEICPKCMRSSHVTMAKMWISVHSYCPVSGQ